ncbi:UNVERIFIED_CONTAM: hypothetical protein GTU68_065745 [Idotea baltica]|nr:hypothetical protein [Idotea baltica]
MVSKYKVSNSLKFFKDKKLKNFLKNKKKSLGKSKGKIVVRHRGGGNKRSFITLNNFSKENLPFKILKTLRDPNRNTFINLILSKNGSYSYCKSKYETTPSNMIYGKHENNISKGSCLPLKFIPRNIPISDIEINPLKGPIFCKSAGTFGRIIGKNLKYALVKLNSGEFRYININSLAVIGANSNGSFIKKKKYKAGQNRFLNKRPKVRGVAMNPIDHPHGGGEGKTSGGRPSVSK